LEEQVEYDVIPKVTSWKSSEINRNDKKELENTQKQLKELELSVLRILEKCDALNPSELLREDEDLGRKDFFILPHLVGTNDESFVLAMEAASESFRKNRSVLVGRLNRVLLELDIVAKTIGVEL
jgi:hypothetical protein